MTRQERALHVFARFLAQETVKDLILGHGPIGMQQCARQLARQLSEGKWDPMLVPIIRDIEHRAVRNAGLKVIDGHGRINHSQRFANDLVPSLADLSISELIRLKLKCRYEAIKARIGRWT